MDPKSLLASIARRDERESKPFAQIINNYFDLYIAWQSLSRDQTSSLTPSASAASPNAPPTNDLVFQYAQKISQLQAELASKYKSEVMDVSSRLSRETEVRTLTENARLDRELLERTRESLRETKARLDEEVSLGARCRDENLTLRDEVGRFRRLLERSEERVRVLSKENADLMERLISEKLKMAEELNNMNNINRDLQTIIDANGGSAALAANLATASSSSTPKKPSVPQAASSAQKPSATADPKQASVPARTKAASTPLGDPPSASSEPLPAFLPVSEGNISEERSVKRLVEYYLPSNPPVQTFSAHELEVPSVRFDESGAVVATCSVDGSVRLWSGSAPHRLESTIKVESTSGNSAFAAALLAVDVRAGVVLATGSDRVARLWSAANGKLLHTLTGHASKIYACRLASDGKTAVTAGTDRKAMVWDVHGGYRLRSINCGSMCNAVAVSDSNAIFAIGHQDKSIRLWDARDGKEILSISGIHQGPIHSVAFFPGRNALLTASRDDTLCVLDLAKPNEPYRRLAHESYHAAFNWSAADVSPNGAFVAAPGHDGKVFVWSVDTGKVIRVLEPNLGEMPSETPEVCAVAWSPVGGGRLVAVDKGGVMRSWVSEEAKRSTSSAADGLGRVVVDEGYATDRLRML